VVRSQRNNQITWKWTTPKRVRIRPKYSATVAFSWQEDKDRINEKKNNILINRAQKNDKFFFVVVHKMLCFIIFFRSV